MAKKLLTSIVFVLCLMCVHASAVSIEQVQPVMPDISVFVHSDGQDFSALKTADISARLDGKPLAVEGFAASDEGIYYVFMIDVSRSIQQEYLDAAKQAVMNTYKLLRPQDQLAVITFGDSVNVLLDGSESADIASQKISSIKSTDNKTHFYDAMDTLVKTASAKDNMRHVAVMVSDGVEDADADIDQAQLEQSIRSGGVAVYGFAVGSASDADLANFRKFVEVSGGEFYAFKPADAQQTLTNMLKQIDAIWCLTLKADSNIADGKMRTLDVKFGTLGSVTAKIEPDKWVPDEVPPYIVSLDTDTAAGTVKVVFSEAMAGLDKLSCYKLISPSGTAPALTLVSSDASTVTLSAPGISKDDGWKMNFSGLTDASMEKNPMPECAVPLSGVAAAVSTATNAAPTDTAAQPQEGVSFPFGIIAALAAAAILVFALIYYKKHGGFKPAKGGKGLAIKPLGKKNTDADQTPHFVFHNVDGESGDDKKE